MIKVVATTTEHRKLCVKFSHIATSRAHLEVTWVASLYHLLKDATSRAHLEVTWVASLYHLWKDVEYQTHMIHRLV